VKRQSTGPPAALRRACRVDAPAVRRYDTTYIPP